MKFVNVGIIGTGFIGELHVESLRRLGNVNVLALAELNEEIAKYKSNTLFIPKYYSDFRELILDDDIEVIHVTTPNYLHYSQVEFALNAKKHVICEKPLGLDSNETRKLVELAKKSKKVNAIIFNFRFFPLVKVMRNMIKTGELGKLYLIRGSFLQDWMLYPTDYNWRANSKLGGKTQVIATVGSHFLDLVQYITDMKIEIVCADFETIHKMRVKKINNKTHKEEFVKVKSEDLSNILLRFSDDTPGSVTFSQVCAGKRLELKISIYGEKGSLEWNSEKPNELWIGKRDEPNKILIKDPNLVKQELRAFCGLPGGHIEGYADSFKQNMKSIYKKIAENNFTEEFEDFATFEDGNDVQLIIDTLFKSAKSKKWLKVCR